MRNTVKGIVLTAASSLTLAVAANPALAVEATQAPAGALSDGKVVTAVTLKAENGVSATILTFGATLWKLDVPDRNGKVADVLLAYDKISDFETRQSHRRRSVHAGRQDLPAPGQ